MTRRRASYRSLVSLQRDNRVCRACIEAGYPLESWPVIEGRPGQRAYILGQAPGIVEGEERRPWRGRAGVTLRRWLAMGENEFYDTFYCASVTRCYPGRAPGGRGDRTPTGREQTLCAFWRDWELRLLRPDLIVPVGTFATLMRACQRCLDTGALEAPDAAAMANQFWASAHGVVTLERAGCFVVGSEGAAISSALARNLLLGMSPDRARTERSLDAALQVITSAAGV